MHTKVDGDVYGGGGTRIGVVTISSNFRYKKSRMRVVTLVNGFTCSGLECPQISPVYGGTIMSAR